MDSEQHRRRIKTSHSIECTKCTTGSEPDAGTLPAWVATKAQLAEHLGISVRTLDRLTANGEGPPGRIRIGSSVRFDLRTVQAWYAARLADQSGAQS